MAENKLDLPEDLLSSRSSDQSWISKVEPLERNEEEKTPMGFFDELKDQNATESSIPLSPQWLYVKPSETKMEMRAPTSVFVENSADFNQKENLRLEGSEDKKDWRKLLPDTDGSRRWREEERETTLLSGRRERRRADRRIDMPNKESIENRPLPPSDRWHDNSRISGHETRRDSKWSSRWGPEDKDKESRSEKRTDAEKEEVHSENLSFAVSNRIASERDSDSRDKWRPRHRIEGNSGGPSSFRAAPGFGPEKGKMDGSNAGFTVGRGRATVSGTHYSAGPIGGAQFYESVRGRSCFMADTFCYPRGKLLDIYRKKRVDPSVTCMSEMPEELSPIIQPDFQEPLAFVIPNAEEEAILKDIWKGTVTSSGAVYNSFRKGQPVDNVTESENLESAKRKQGIYTPDINDQTSDSLEEFANCKACQTDGKDPCNNGLQMKMVDERDIDSDPRLRDIGTTSKKDSNPVMLEVSKSSTYCIPVNIGACDTAMKVGEIWQSSHSSLTRYAQFDDGGSSGSVVLPPSHPNQSHHLELLERDNETNKNFRGTPEELSLYYSDPQGDIQGPFLGVDIISWFEQGFFGTDLPVRLADAPEGTPFQCLGEVMPHLNGRDGHAKERDLSCRLDESGGPGSSCYSAHHPDYNDSVTLPGPRQVMPELSGLPSQVVEPKMLENIDLLQLSHSGGQNLHDFFEQDEEIVFSGRPRSSDHQFSRSSSGYNDALPNSISRPPLSNELPQYGLLNQEMHSFGLLRTEHEGSYPRHAPSAMSSSFVKAAAPCGSVKEPMHHMEGIWPGAYANNALSSPNMFHDSMLAGHILPVEQESMRFDLEEQLIAQQSELQLQHQQRNQMLPRGQLNDLLLEQMENCDLTSHQQLASHPSPDLEHFLTRRLQQQQQLQLQQQFQQQQQLLQEQQQSQVRQLLLERMMQNQLHEPTLAQPHMDAIRRNNFLDQVLSKQQLLRELQQHSYHPSNHAGLSIDQLVQAKFGQSPPQEHSLSNFLDILSQSQRGQRRSLEQQQHYEEQQLLARHLSMGLRQHVDTIEDRHMGPAWPADETNDLIKSISGTQHAADIVNPLDMYHRQQRLAHEDQLSRFEHNLSLRGRSHQGVYEPASFTSPVGAPGMNLDAVNAMARIQGLDLQEPDARMHAAGQMNSLSSDALTRHHSLVPSQFDFLHHGAIGGRWSENNENDWMGSQISLLQPNSEHHLERGPEVKVAAEDPRLWMSDGINEDKSKQLLMELLRKKSGYPCSELLDMNKEVSYERKVPPPSIFSGLNPSHHDLGPENSCSIGSYGSTSSGLLQQSHLSDGLINSSSFPSNDNFLLRSSSGAHVEEPLLPRTDATVQGGGYVKSSVIGRLAREKEVVSDLRGMKHGREGGSFKGSNLESRENIADKAGVAAVFQGGFAINAFNRHDSLGINSGNSEFYNERVHDSMDGTDRVPTILSKGQETSLMRRPPGARSFSQEGSSTAGSRQQPDSGVNVGMGQGSDLLVAGKKEARFRRTSSGSDSSLSETSFIDMLKSSAKKAPSQEAHAAAAAPESSEATQGGRGGKKKGKKGRQIDPALLGFKVSSNRILMGEIQRIED